MKVLFLLQLGFESVHVVMTFKINKGKLFLNAKSTRALSQF